MCQGSPITHAAQTLCKKIAEAEMPGTEIITSHPQVDGAPDMYWKVGSSTLMAVPAYLTDPAETVRMLEALLEDGWLLYKGGDKVFSWSKSDWLGSSKDEYCCRNKQLEYATAEAYLAMLLEQQES